MPRRMRPLPRVFYGAWQAGSKHRWIKYSSFVMPDPGTVFCSSIGDCQFNRCRALWETTERVTNGNPFQFNAEKPVSELNRTFALAILLLERCHHALRLCCLAKICGSTRPNR